MHTPRILASLCAVAFGLTAVTDVAEARPRPRRGKRFEANKTFGLGLMLGAPTGLSGKYFYASDRAIDFGLGVIGRYRHRDGVHLHVDHLWHPVSLVSEPAFELPLYVGIGGRFFNWNDDRDGYPDGQVLGVRVPLGIAFDFNNVPLDVFVEVAFVLDFFIDDTSNDDIGTDLNGAVGVRYWF
jgi:hypothetical protein